MAAHRTIRKFLPTPVPDADVHKAVEAAEKASTSSWIQAYALLQITDGETRRELRALTGDQAQVEEAGAFFCVCADTRRHRLIAEDAGVPHAANLETFLLSVVDTSLFAQNLALAFEAQGHGICFIGALRNHLPEVDRLLELPEGVIGLYGLCVGEPDPESPLGGATEPRPRLAVDAVWTRDRYPGDDEIRAHVEDMDRRANDYYRDRGQPKRDWSGGIWRTFRAPSREHLHDHFESKGARLR